MLKEMPNSPGFPTLPPVEHLFGFQQLHERGEASSEPAWMAWVLTVSHDKLFAPAWPRAADCGDPWLKATGGGTLTRREVDFGQLCWQWW